MDTNDYPKRLREAAKAFYDAGGESEIEHADLLMEAALELEKFDNLIYELQQGDDL